MEEKIINIICEIADVKPEEIKTDASLWSDLDLDSFTKITILAEIEEAFDIIVPDRKLMQIQTVDDLYSVVRELTEN